MNKDDFDRFAKQHPHKATVIAYAIGIPMLGALGVGILIAKVATLYYRIRANYHERRLAQEMKRRS